MHAKWQKQMPLIAKRTDLGQSKELEAIRNMIDANPAICERVLQGLNKGKNSAHR